MTILLLPKIHGGEKKVVERDECGHMTSQFDWYAAEFRGELGHKKRYNSGGTKQTSRITIAPENFFPVVYWG